MNIYFDDLDKTGEVEEIKDNVQDSDKQAFELMYLMNILVKMQREVSECKIMNRQNNLDKTGSLKILNVL